MQIELVQKWLQFVTCWKLQIETTIVVTEHEKNIDECILNKIHSSNLSIVRSDDTLNLWTNLFAQPVIKGFLSEKTSISAVSYRSSPAREIRDLATTK